jgi:hypothetical protein
MSLESAAIFSVWEIVEWRFLHNLTLGAFLVQTFILRSLRLNSMKILSHGV